MTLFGFIWIILIIICSVKIEYMIVLTIISATIQCSNVIVVGGTGVGPQIITSFAFILTAFLKNRLRIKRKIQDKGLIRYNIYIFIVAAISSYYNGNICNNGIKLMQLYIYILCSLFMYYVANTMKQNDVYQLVRRLTIGMIVFGFVQFSFSAGILPKIWIFDQIFFNDKGKYIYYHSIGGYKRLLGSYMEPSYYASFVVAAFYYFLSLKERRKENRGIIILLGFQIVLTFSSSAYGALVIVGLLFFLVSSERKFKVKIFVLAGISFLGFYLLFYDVLDRVVFSKLSMENASYRVRHWSDIQAFDMFKKSPIIGIGYKSTRASSLLTTLLGEMGILGLITYVLANGRILFNIYITKIKKRSNDYELAISLAVLSAVAVQLIAVPDLDICTYWMWMNIMMLQLGKSTNV